MWETEKEKCICCTTNTCWHVKHTASTRGIERLLVCFSDVVAAKVLSKKRLAGWCYRRIYQAYRQARRDLPLWLQHSSVMIYALFVHCVLSFRHVGLLFRIRARWKDTGLEKKGEVSTGLHLNVYNIVIVVD